MKKGRKSSRRAKSRKPPKSHKGKGGSVVLRLISFEISFEPLPDPLIEELPRRDRERIQRIIEQFRRSPADYVHELEQLVADYPHLPKLHNLLTVAYKYARRDEDAGRLIEETYRKFPNYLFGKTNYALELLLDGRVEDVPDVFDGKLELNLLYPHRRVFHASEVVSFYSTLALYLYATGDDQQARSLYDELLSEIDPDNPLVRRVGDLFSRNPMRRFAARLDIRPGRADPSGPPPNHRR